MRYSGILALSLAWVFSGVCVAWAKTESVSQGSAKHQFSQEQDSRRALYTKSLIDRPLSGEDAGICADFVPKGDQEKQQACHVTRNYLADIHNKKSNLIRPFYASPDYFVTEDEWKVMKALM